MALAVFLGFEGCGVGKLLFFANDGTLDDDGVDIQLEVDSDDSDDSDD